MLSADADYSGSDHTVNVKLLNPNVAEQTGVFAISYFQSLSKRVAVGVETIIQRAANGLLESGMTLAGRFTTEKTITTLSLVPQNGAIQASYLQRVTDKVQLGSELQLLANSSQREAVATLGCKFDLRGATFRGQIDTSGRVGMVLEEKLAPGLSLMLSGEIDHFKGNGKFGFGMIFQ